MANVVVTMTGDEARLVKALSKVIAKETEMAAKFRDIGKESKKAGKEVEGAFSQRALNNLAKYTAGMVSVSTAIQLVNRMMEDQKRLGEEGSRAGMDLAKAQQETIKNLAGLTSEQKTAALQEAGAIARRTGMSETKVVQAIGAGFSASGDIEKTLSAVEAAAKLTRLTPEQMDTVTAGALDVAAGSGITDAERNMGFLLGAGGISRIEDPVKLSTNLAPVVASGVHTVPGQAREEAASQIAAIFGALSLGATDRRGESTGTAATTLIAKLQQFFEKRKDDPGEVFGRIELLQENARLRKQFLGDKGFGEERFKGPIQQLLTKNSDLWNKATEAAGDIRFDSGIYRQHVQEVGNMTKELELANLQAKSQATTAGSSIDTHQARGIAGEILSDTLARTQVSMLDYATNFANRAAFEVFGGDLNIAIDRLEQRLSKVQTTQDLGMSAIGGADMDEMKRLLREQIGVLKDMKTSLERPQRTQPQPSSRPNQLGERAAHRE